MGIPSGSPAWWTKPPSSLSRRSSPRASPIANPVGMNAHHEVSLSKLSRDQRYTTMFAQFFGSGPIYLRRVENALASFERTVLSGNSI